MLITTILWNRIRSTNSDEAIRRTYDQEYGATSSRYCYSSAMLSKDSFEIITGLTDVHGVEIIDIGAGSNEFLRFCNETLHIPASQLTGVDVSPMSVRIIESDGIAAYQGRIEELKLPKNGFDLAYLSYFIDYDTNQQATFDAAIDLIKPGGRIVLEGQFPVRPFALLKKDRKRFSFVTKGETVEEDVRLISESFAALGLRKGKDVRLERILHTYRYVRSHYGFNRLPSFFLTFSVGNS